MNTQIEGGSIQDAYSEVYDWRPSVEKTDVMRTMEAIEGYSFCHICTIFVIYLNRVINRIYVRI